MQHDSPIFIRLGILINAIVIAALLVLALRAFQPAFAGMNGMGLGNMGMSRGAGRGMGAGMGMGTGGNSSMMSFHHAEIPADFAGLTSPVAADDASLTRGQAAYELYCVSCHGVSGLGDGVAAATLDPVPAPIARTSQMLGDDYLFWRISEGGTHFSTAMPAWQGALDEQVRWDLINYVRTLGSGGVAGGMGQMNGNGADPAVEAALHESMVSAGIEQGLITKAEGETFLVVHSALNTYMSANQTPSGTGPMMNQQEEMLTAMVQAGTVTQAEADTFVAVRDALLNAGLMQ